MIITGNVVDASSPWTAQPERMADFTCLGAAEGWLDVGAVINPFSRGVVEWSMNDAVAVWRCRKLDSCCITRTRVAIPVEQFQRLMADKRVSCLMSRSGNVRSNAAMGSFFSSLEAERGSKKLYRTRMQTMATTRIFLQSDRRCPTQRYLGPVDFDPKRDSPNAFVPLSTKAAAGQLMPSHSPADSG